MQLWLGGINVTILLLCGKLKCKQQIIADQIAKLLIWAQHVCSPDELICFVSIEVDLRVNWIAYVTDTTLEINGSLIKLSEKSSNENLVDLKVFRTKLKDYTLGESHLCFEKILVWKS